MKMTISITPDFLKLIEDLSKKTGLKKSTIVRLAVEEWSNKNDRQN